MVEGILIGIIVFAVGYTLAMRVMARRSDVLHGEFVQHDGVAEEKTTLSWLSTVQRYVHGVRMSVRH